MENKKIFLYNEFRVNLRMFLFLPLLFWISHFKKIQDLDKNILHEISLNLISYGFS